jgi:hypothetical protein
MRKGIQPRPRTRQTAAAHALDSMLVKPFFYFSMLEEDSLQSGVATVVLDAGQLTPFALGAVDWRGAHADGHEGSGVLVIGWGRHVAIVRVGLL